jgi:hypothetical protein
MLELPQDGPTLVVNSDDIGAPAQEVTSGDVTLSLAEGISILLDVEDLIAGDLGKKFRALSIPEAQREWFVSAELGLTSLFALAPFEAQFVDAARAPLKARLSFANTAALPAASAVEVLALGSYLFPDWVTPARFEVVARGTVTSDGARVELDEGEGVEYLTWVGIRPVQ